VAGSADRTRTTFRHELWRAGTAGIIETAGTTFLLLIAVSWFEAGSVAKALVSGSGALGLLLSPVFVTLVASRHWRTTRAAACALLLGAGCFVLAAWQPRLPVFVICSVLAMATSSIIIPLVTQLYHDNYPSEVRGRLFSRTVMVRIATAAVFGKVAGDALDRRMDAFPILLLVLAGALVTAAFCLSRCPGRPLGREGSSHPLRALRYAREDRLFRLTLISWMLLGFANLMMLPLRIEYLANPAYGLALTAGKVALLTVVIPNIARLLLSPVWGHFFDHMNFFLLRSLLNIGFIVGMLLFFLSDSLPGLMLGAVVFGVANAGGEVAWSLWVTKFAQPERVADYMSVHTFLTGVRGVAAPLCGFFLAQVVSLDSLALVSGIIMMLATLLLMPEVWKGGGTGNGSRAEGPDPGPPEE